MPELLRDVRLVLRRPLLNELGYVSHCLVVARRVPFPEAFSMCPECVCAPVLLERVGKYIVPAIYHLCNSRRASEGEDLLHPSAAARAACMAGGQKVSKHPVMYK